MGMSFDSFCQLTVSEFDKALKRWSEKRDREYQDKWEQTRLICMIPHLQDKKTVIELLTFPWDKNKAKKQAKVRDPERFERLKKEYGKTL